MVSVVSTITDTTIKQNKSYRPSDCSNVSLYDNKGSIGIKFTCPIQGKQREFNIGKLKWLNISDHRTAKLKALELDNDLRLGLYDGDRNKYKLGKVYKTKTINKPKAQQKELTLIEAWEYYKSKKQSCSQSQKNNTWKPLDKYLDTKSTLDDVSIFADSLIGKYSNYRVTKILKTLSSAINMSIKHGKTKKKNYLPDIIDSIDTDSNSSIDSYSQDDVKLILRAFKENTYCNPNSAYKHSYYYQFVALRAYTGMRPSEAIALTWDDIKMKDDRTFITINKRYTDNEIKKGTKNGVDCRIFPCNDKLVELLKSIYKVENENNLIFPSTRDKGYINRTRFSQRYWSKVINGLYDDKLIDKKLNFYSLRHTFCTHLCRSGAVDLPTIASLVGNSVPTLINNYLATDENIELPDLF